MTSPQSSSSPAFSLVELLVAMAVVVLIGVLVVQMVGTTTALTLQQSKGIDSLNDARVVLDRLGTDWTSRSRRKDLPVQSTLQVGSDRLAFLSHVPAYSGSRPLAVVDYSVSGSPPTLRRATLGFNWGAADAAPDQNPVLTFPLLSLPLPAATDSEILSPGVFRWELAYLRKSDGRLTLDPNASPGGTDFGGLLVVLALLDEKNRKLAPPAALDTLPQYFPDAVETAAGLRSPMEVWQEILDNPPALAGAGLPDPTRQGIRLFQRVFYPE